MLKMRKSVHFRWTGKVLTGGLIRRKVIRAALVLWLTGMGLVLPAVEWQPFGPDGAGHRMTTLPLSSAGGGSRAGFSLRTGQSTGVLFTNVLTDIKLMVNQNLLNGSGVAMGDFDGDGLCDLFFTNLNEGNALYRNLGDWKFEDVTDSAGVGMEGMNATGAAFADTDGDGDLDLLVTTMGNPNIHYRNNGNGTFTVRTDFPGMRNEQGSTSMALGDVDGDGDLDLYTTNFGAQSLVRSGGLVRVTYRNGQPVVRGRFADRIKIIAGKMYELGEADYFYLNDGQGGFIEEPISSGRFRNEKGEVHRNPPLDQGLCVAFRDLNGDRAPDLYICNDAFTPDRFFLNDGRGILTEIDPLQFRKTPFFSMGADFADIDRDGDDDFIVVDMLSRRHLQRMTQRGTMPPRPPTLGAFNVRDQVRRNNFYLNRGDGSFAEIANFSNLSASGWSWSPVFIDVDLDGWEDLLITNGFMYDVDDMDSEERIEQTVGASLTEQRRAILTYPRLDSPNYAFRNLRNLRFGEQGQDWGFNSTEVSNGMATGDLDNDGDPDIAISVTNGQALLYENIGDAPRIAIRLAGRSPNTRGVGARIILKGGPVIQSQEMMAGGRYVSGDDYLRVFAATPGADHTVVVEWRDGSETELGGLKANHMYLISADGAVSSQGGSSLSGPSDASRPMFEDRSDLLGHSHDEILFDDFSRQPLLPRKFSQSGPGVAVADFNSDGLDDIAIGDGRGGRVSIHETVNTGNGLTRSKSREIGASLKDDILGIVAFRTDAAMKVPHLAAGQAAYEDSGSGGGIHVHPDGDSAMRGLSDISADAAGALCAADFDGDGDVDLVAAGTVSGGAYPMASPSRLLVNEDGEFRSAVPLPLTGLPRGATAADLDLDGVPEIIIACEWGPIKVFSFRDASLTDLTEKWGTSVEPGLWQSVAAADVNNDGWTDIIAGNWGLNDYYSSEGMKPMHLYFISSLQAGGVPLVEAYREPSTGDLLPYRDRMMTSKVFPELQKTVPSHRAYGMSTIPEIYRTRWNQFEHLEATELRSCVFINDGGGRLVKKPLPDHAQFSPAFGIVPADWDGDGSTDLFMAQNFFPQQEDAPKLDAGTGLILKGDGSGVFEHLPDAFTGVRIYGEQRGAATGDFNNDFRPDLVVAQNAAETRLFLNANTAARPGIRIRLEGPPSNPDGLGATVLISREDGRRCAIPVVAGGGFFSQSAVSPLVGSARDIAGIEVLWPGGRRTAVPPGKTAEGTTVSIVYR